MKVEGGFGKWSMEFFDKNLAIHIEFDHYPNIGSIKLYDADKADLLNLSRMFLDAASKYDEISDKLMDEYKVRLEGVD